MSDRYLVTARKYRPQTFRELVSQEHVAGTLKNAMRLDRLAHAYLFCGPRGVGKTTAARILAKAINCTTPIAERDEYEPCRQCDSCRSFEEGRNLNIIEIDAASNNSVEDVRSLRDKVRIPPQGAKKKVYIIDEVHMLSNAAFNALLKTLEEPPPHVLFIFATTEPHKVLPTILSRCQRFDFRRITVPETVERLRLICDEEGLTADEASLMLIARKGDGALRDALSVFDQAVSLCGTTLQYEALAQALGVVDADLFFDVTQKVIANDRAGLLGFVQTVMLRGYDLQETLTGLAEHLRNLLVARTMQSTDLIEADGATKTRYERHAQDFSENDLLRLLMLVAEAEETVKTSVQPRLRFELALLKMASLGTSADLHRLLRRLDELEKNPALAAAQASPAVRPEAPAVPSTKEPTAKTAPVQPLPQKPPAQPEVVRAAPEREATEAKPAEPKPAELAPVPEIKALDPQPEPPTDDEDGGLPIVEPVLPLSPSPSAHTPRPAPPAPAPSIPEAPSLFGQPALKRRRPAPPQNVHPEPAGDGAQQEPEPETPIIDFHFGISVEQIKRVWASVVADTKRDKVHVGALLQHTQPARIGRGGIVEVNVPDAFHQRLLRIEVDHIAGVLQHALQHEKTLAIEFVVDTAQSADVQESEVEADPFEHMKRLRQENELIRALFDQFGGELVW